MSNNIYQVLPIPIGNGAGTPVDVDRQGLKTFTIGGVFDAKVIVEVGIGGVFAPVAAFDQPDQTVDVPAICDQVRIRVANFRSGSVSAFVGGEPANTSFGVIPMPAGDGAGTPLDTEFFGNVRSIITGGTFEAIVTYETSEDLSGPWAAIYRADKPAQIFTSEKVGRFVRAVVTGFVSGTPTAQFGGASPAEVDCQIVGAAAANVLTLDGEQCSNLTHNLGAIVATTLANPVNVVPGQRLVYALQAAGIGAVEPITSDAFLFVGGVIPTFSTGANEVDKLTCYVRAVDANGTATEMLCDLGLDYGRPGP